MKKFRNILKKGGVADIITLMVIVGLVIALIIAVVLPMINQAQKAGTDNSGMINNTTGFINSLAGEGATALQERGVGGDSPDGYGDGDGDGDGDEEW